MEKHNINFKKIVQSEGEFVVTFPRAFHFGFNRGLSIAEASNFAVPSWVEFGNIATHCTCRYVLFEYISFSRYVAI